MIEKEIKALISKAQFFTILKAFQWNSPITQINHYYIDPSGAQKEKNISIRIRECSGLYKLQMKVPKKSSGLLHIEEEYECSIDSVPDTLVDLRVEDIILKNAIRIGKLTTYRYVFYYDEFTEICLDKNEYLDYIDYEIEIEFKHDIPPELIALLSELGIKNDVYTPGKYARFISKVFNNNT